MSPISKVILFSLFVTGHICAVQFNENDPHIYKTVIPIEPRNGMMGVTSVARILSSNNKLSAVGGVHYFPSSSLSHKISVAIQNKKSSKKNDENIVKLLPNTVWKKGSKGKAEGSINIYPGGVVVSSSAQSGNIGPNRNHWANPFNPMIWPMNDLYRGPSSNFNYHGNIDWMQKDIFSNYVPPNLYLKRTWLYPTFNPFLN